MFECWVSRPEDGTPGGTTVTRSPAEYLEFSAEHRSGELILELPRGMLPSRVDAPEYERFVMSYVERAVRLLEERRDALLESLDRAVEPEADTLPRAEPG